MFEEFAGMESGGIHKSAGDLVVKKTKKSKKEVDIKPMIYKINERWHLYYIWQPEVNRI